MKYLYYIFRLFKCPHKWESKSVINFKMRTGEFSREVHISQCKKCGKLKSFEIT